MFLVKVKKHGFVSLTFGPNPLTSLESGTLLESLDRDTLLKLAEIGRLAITTPIKIEIKECSKEVVRLGFDNLSKAIKVDFTRYKD